MSDIPPMNRVPVWAPRFLEVKEMGVAEWVPGPPGSGPPTMVVLHFAAQMPDGSLAQFGLRLKSPAAVNRLIAMLERHRNGVWPSGHQNAADVSLGGG